METKICHFIWDKSPLAFLNAVSVWSFKKYHPEWKIWIWIINQRFERKWSSKEHDILYDGPCYMDNLSKEVDRIIPLDPTDIHPSIKNTVHLSDLFRYQALLKHGGLYSDFDILYLKPLAFDLTKTIIFGNWEARGRHSCFHWPVAMFYAPAPSARFWESIVKFSNESSAGKTTYQAFGCDLWARMIPVQKFPAKNDLERMAHLQNSVKDKGDVIVECAKNYLPVPWFDAHRLYKPLEGNPYAHLLNLKEGDCIFSIHWFNGARASKRFLKTLNRECLMGKLIEPYLEHL